MNIDPLIRAVVVVLNAITVLILLYGVAKTGYQFVRGEFGSGEFIDKARRVQMVKAALGTYILLALEVLIAADIIASILNPTMNDILMLAAVVLIRTVISYFLGKEIEASGEELAAGEPELRSAL